MRHSMSSFDGRVVRFGGYDQRYFPLGDTWILEADTWRKYALDPSPAARYEAAMAWDPGLGTAVLLGGERRNDTWTLRP